MEVYKILEAQFATELKSYALKLHTITENLQDFPLGIEEAHDLMHKIVVHKIGVDLLNEINYTPHDTERESISFNKLKEILEV